MEHALIIAEMDSSPTVIQEPVILVLPTVKTVLTKITV